MLLLLLQLQQLAAGGAAAAIMDNKAGLLRMSAAELAARFGAPVPPTRAGVPYQDKIEHFVVLFLENRAADHSEQACAAGSRCLHDGCLAECTTISDPAAAAAAAVPPCAQFSAAWIYRASTA